jgi:rhodanese-related sulfurtransferase
VIKTAAKQGLLLAALALLPAIGQALYLRDQVSWQRPPAGNEISIREAKAWGQSVMWIDARPEAEFTAAHIPGALSLNTERWDDLLPKVLNSWSPNRKLIVYCSKQTCGASREIARRLREEAQLKNVSVLSGGWEAWQDSQK